MRIVCLAWGSLVWKSGPLPVRGGWRTGGPSLPIEFGRVGDGGELATVLVDGAAPVPVRWTELDLDTLEAAREALRRREDVPASRPEGIGSVLLGAADGANERAGERHGSGSSPSSVAERIVRWAGNEPGGSIDAVVWTALPPRLDDEEGRLPTVDEAVAYLAGLGGQTRAHAEHYVRRVPVEIRTPYRTAIEQALGWTPVSD